jgi:hypothetical protein
MVPIGLVAIWDRPADAIPAGWVEHTDLSGKTAVGHLDGDTNFGNLGGKSGYSTSNTYRKSFTRTQT